MSSSNTHALIWWPADGQGTVGSLSAIKDPRKPFDDYQKGDRVLARCTGFAGLHNGIIVEVGDKKGLDVQLIAPDFIMKGKAIEDGTAVHQVEDIRSNTSTHTEFPVAVKRVAQQEKPSNSSPLPSSSDKRLKLISEQEKPSSDILHRSPPPSSSSSDKSSSNISPKPTPKPTQKSPSTPAGGCTPKPSESSPKPTPKPTQKSPSTPAGGCTPKPSESFPVTRKEFSMLVEDMKKMKRRIHQLEKDAKEGPGAAHVVKPSVLEAGNSPETAERPASHKEGIVEAESQPGQSTASSHSESSDDPPVMATPTDDQLADLVRHVDKPYTATRLLLCALFPAGYIKTHSVSGKAANRKIEAKPIFDQRLYSKMVGTLKSKFPTMKTSDITSKVHAVQKSMKG